LKKDGLHMQSPCENITLGDKNTKTPIFYKPWELFLFLQICLSKKQTKVLHANLFSALCGLRLKETTRITHDQVNHLRPDVYVRVEQGKTSKRRRINRPWSFFTWMKSVDYKFDGDGTNKKPIATKYSVEDASQYNRKIASVVTKHLPNSQEFSMGQNMCRQSFAAHHFALHKNKPLLVELMGNSSEVLETNYDGLATPEEAEIYFSLMPAMRYPFALQRINELQEKFSNEFEEIRELEKEYETKIAKEGKVVFVDTKKYNREFLLLHGRGVEKNLAEEAAIENATVNTVPENVMRALSWKESGKQFLGWDITNDAQTMGVTKSKIYLEENLGVCMEELHHSLIDVLSKK